MGIGTFVGFFVLPFILAVSPGIMAGAKVKRLFGPGWFYSKPFIIFNIIYVGLLSWSWFNVWSIMYGPMSKEDWGPGIVTAMGVVFFQLAPLIITVPMAVFTVRRYKT
ncbi:MAG: hypothetical protein PVG66_05130 [Chromatiales bacterium]|jgi:hypothetical protein